MFLFISCLVCLHLPSIYVVDSPQFQQNSHTLPRQMNEEFQQLNIGEEHQAGQQMSSVPSNVPSTSQRIEPSETDLPSTSNREPIESAQCRRNIPKKSFKKTLTPNKTKNYSVANAIRNCMANRTQRRKLESYHSRDASTDPQGSVLV